MDKVNHVDKADANKVGKGLGVKWWTSEKMKEKEQVAMLECIQLFYTQDCLGPARLGVFLAWLFDAWQPDGSYPLWAVVGSEDATRGAEKDEAKRRAPGSSA